MRDELFIILGDKRYKVNNSWAKFKHNESFGLISDVSIDSNNNVYVFQRTNPPLLVFNPIGELINCWGHGTFSDAHGIYLNKDDLVMLVDRDAHEIVTCDKDGKILFRMGKRNFPNFNSPFNHPTDIAQSSNGDLYISDGYGNSNVHCFSSDGTHKFSWGSQGSGPGEFTTPHAIWVDNLDRILVADRENNRIQIFESNGRYINSWYDFYHPMDIFGDVDGYIYITDQIPRLSMISSNGKLNGRCRPVLFGAHGISGDSNGNLYLAEAAPINSITCLMPI